jgi:hypothetical protein
MVGSPELSVAAICPGTLKGHGFMAVDPYSLRVVDDGPAVGALIREELRQHGHPAAPPAWCQSHHETLFLPGNATPARREVA